jgi:hypothetical protein
MAPIPVFCVVMVWRSLSARAGRLESQPVVLVTVESSM